MPLVRWQTLWASAVRSGIVDISMMKSPGCTICLAGTIILKAASSLLGMYSSELGEACLSISGFSYARNNPIIVEDTEGYTSFYILYDGCPDESEGGKGFPIQVAWWEEFQTDKGYSVEKEGFSSVIEFVEDWNNMPDECDFLIIIAYGAEGTLDCNGERLGISYEAGNEYPITHLSTQLSPQNS